MAAYDKPRFNRHLSISVLKAEFGATAYATLYAIPFRVLSTSCCDKSLIWFSATRSCVTPVLELHTGLEPR
jgi:hypothetical protein